MARRKRSQKSSKKTARKKPRKKSDVTDKNLNAADAAAKALKDAPAIQKKMLAALVAKVDNADIALFDPGLFVKMVKAHCELAKTREKGKSKLRIYQHVLEDQGRIKTIIDIVSDDAAFLVDSAVAAINRNNLLIDLLVHPILYTSYESGKLKDITEKRVEKWQRQSHIHVQINEAIPDERLKELKISLEAAMEDVFIANRDWQNLLAKLKEAREELGSAKTKAPKADIDRNCAFLDYLYNNNFTLLGFREYEFTEKSGKTSGRIVKGSGLGLLAADIDPPYLDDADERLPRGLQDTGRKLPPVSVSKTRRLSSVHRPVPMDVVTIKTYDENGRVKGEKLFLGLFTSVTYSRSVSDVPFLREKVEEVVEMSGFIPGSHNRKAMRHILEKYPRDELFQIDSAELFDIVLNILRLQERQRIALFTRCDSFGRYISCLVYVPKDRFGTKLRKRMEAILEEELGGTCTNFSTTLDDSVFARVMYMISVGGKALPAFDPAAIELKLQDTGKTWPELLQEALIETLPGNNAKITALSRCYSEAFPLSYISQYTAKQAVFDIEKIEEALKSKKLILDLYRSKDAELNQLRLKVYNLGAPLTLSDVMPILEDMGLRAISELPFEIKPKDAESSLWIHDFLLETTAHDEFIIVHEVKEKFEKAFTKIWYNDMESDGLNKLVLSAKANWHEITILRAYVRYLRQVGYPFSRPYIQKALTGNPKISRMIIDLFKAFHNPANGKDAGSYAAGCAIGIDHELEKVESLDQDRILRTLTALVEASLRTNYFQRGADGNVKPYLSIKFDSHKVPDLPEPKPYREIFVYSPRVEGIHLRGDKIARGGLRWSDRHEDFRTEVLGLMKAQMVKNAVIVPMGAKGGFVVKTPIKDRKAFHAEGVECYKTFIRGLLDITDNLKGKKIVPPKDVVRRDGDDPYLVVAADKGTAAFSDIANSLSAEYGFWLGDAFASGGSAGYDHKKMGITARGAWESVKLHFRQLNHNTQTKPFDVIGIGDMGGDVFGNGMLCSNRIRLIGAFNHLHIFCDPDPDPAESFKERKRLFTDVAGWDAYDTKKLSKGGKIYRRDEKILTLTPEIRKRFDIEAEKITPGELIRAMLKGRSDLLFFGGIGTYVKSARETHIDVGDKTNDALRVNACELRAKVIGEGANLAVTQRGRIEFAEKGGKINTDFLDNSAGVDSSDHEVNIKILLTEVMRDKTNKMDTAVRNKLLEKMTEEVGTLVLRNNYQQAQAISLAELQARETLQLQEEFIQDMERDHGLSRALEGLPDKEVIENRLRAGKGLTRPELCVLLAYSKIRFTQDLLASDVPDSPEMRDWLIDYFPVPLRKDFRDEIVRHRLARELVATMMANSMVNRMGPTFLKSRMKKTGASVAEIARAYIIVREAFGLRALWDQIEDLDNKVPAEVQLKAMREIAHLAEHAITWFLTRIGHSLDLAADTAAFGKGIQTLRDNFDKLTIEGLKTGIDQRISAGKRDGLPESLARDIAMMPVLSSACDIIRVSLEQKADIMSTAYAYFEIGEIFHIDWLRQQARFMVAEDHWHAEATTGLIDQLYGCQAAITVRILKDMKGRAKNGSTLVEKWMERHSGQIAQINPIFADLRGKGTVDLAMLIIAEQRLRNLSGH